MSDRWGRFDPDRHAENSPPTSRPARRAGIAMNHGLFLMLRIVAIAAIAALVSGCGHPSRLSVEPIDEMKRASVLGIPNARFFVDEPAPMMAEADASVRKELAYYQSQHRPLPPSEFL